MLDTVPLPCAIHTELSYLGLDSCLEPYLYRLFYLFKRSLTRYNFEIKKEQHLTTHHYLHHGTPTTHAAPQLRCF